MSEAPEQIWCSTGLYYTYVKDWSEGSWSKNDDSGVEYTRTDLVRAQIEAAVKRALEGAADAQILRWIAEGYDKEDAALIGEPDPWALDDAGDIGDAETWQAERIACARRGLLNAFARAALAELKGDKQ
jgi:hypothetical protein